MSDNNIGAVLELYRMTVRNLLAGDKPGAVPNSSYKHASIIIEELVRAAKTSFHAYCGRMSADVWTVSVKEQLILAIKRGVDVRIVLSEHVDLDVPQVLKECIAFLPCPHEGTRSAFDAAQHFAVIDGKSLRLEDNMERREALFAANHPEIAVELDKIFQFLRESSKAA